MPYAQPPQEQAGDQEHRRQKRQQTVRYHVRTSGQIEHRIVLTQRKRNHERAEPQNSLAVDCQRICTELPTAVREDVHEFQPFRREEADGSVDDEQSRENDRSAENHQRECEDFVPCPDNAAPRKDDAEHDECLKKSSETGELDFRAEHLQNHVPRANHDPVEFPVAEHRREPVKSSCEAFRN